jgi:EAL domain-containing protein (putative c-di-GMP-specific phosphodiesterase class I)
VQQYGVDPGKLKIELTESQLSTDVEEIISKMSELKKFGIRFSLDDFGTGYSSLAFLKRLPLDQVKIDRSFVMDLLDDPNDAAIAGTIMTLASSLGLEAIAEGVESKEQIEFLQHLGCHMFQGYLFSPPLPVEEFESYARAAGQNMLKDLFAKPQTPK